MCQQQNHSLFWKRIEDIEWRDVMSDYKSCLSIPWFHCIREPVDLLHRGVKQFRSDLPGSQLIGSRSRAACAAVVIYYCCTRERATGRSWEPWHGSRINNMLLLHYKWSLVRHHRRITVSVQYVLTLSVCCVYTQAATVIICFFSATLCPICFVRGDFSFFPD